MTAPRPSTAPAPDPTTGNDATDPDAWTLPTGRVEAFSDGVIAVAATLLVLEIAEPPETAHLWPFLRDQLPSLAAYVVSFLTILIFWVNHHALFHALRRVSRGMLFVNGLLLLGISFISYSTAVLGRALQAGHDERSAAVLYALVLGLAAGCFTTLWSVIARRPSLLLDAARGRERAALRRSLTGPVVYAAAVLVALVDARASLLLDFLAAVYFAVLPRHLRRPRPGGER